MKTGGAIAMTDFVLFFELQHHVTRFELRAQKNSAVCYSDLTLVFAELAKFELPEAQLTTPIERGLYCLKTARDLTSIPPSFATEPVIFYAL